LPGRHNHQIGRPLTLKVASQPYLTFVKSRSFSGFKLIVIRLNPEKVAKFHKSSIGKLTVIVNCFSQPVNKKSPKMPAFSEIFADFTKKTPDPFLMTLFKKFTYINTNPILKMPYL
jgi:hypothetical protein